MMKRDKMIAEAVERLALMQVDNEDMEQYRENMEIPVYFVNHKERKIMKSRLNEKQKNIIADLEKDGEKVVYYAIVDEGMWPDGCSFERWSFLVVGSCINDWEIERQAITASNFRFVSAYIYNCEEPDCSERVEMPFRNVNGIIINIS